MTKIHQKKVKLAVEGRRARFAPFWAVVKKFGPGKKIHPSEITARRRHWRQTKLKIKPRRTTKKHLG